MSKKKQITITLPNKVGELSRLTRRLKKSKVNMEAICVSNLLDTGVVRFVPNNLAAAKKALAGYGATISVDDVIGVMLPHKIGALGAAAAKLQAKKINIEYVYGSAALKGGKSLCIFKTSDQKAAEKILG